MQGNTTFRKLDLFHCPVIEVSSFCWTQQNRYIPFLSHLTTETDPVSETLCFLVFRIPDEEQIPETQYF
jgi:hypothetical protein